MTDSFDRSGIREVAVALAVILEDENRALAKLDFAASGRLALCKRAAIEQAESSIAGANPSSVKDDRNLVPVRRRLASAIAANRALLQTSIATQQRVIETVMRALDACGDEARYPARAGADSGRRVVMPMTLALRA